MSGKEWKQGWLEEIMYVQTGDSVTLYWEKKEPLPSGCHFFVYQDGVLAETTGKTHVRLEGLRPETEYRFQVRLAGPETEGNFQIEPAGPRPETEGNFQVVPAGPRSEMEGNFQVVPAGPRLETEDQVQAVPPVNGTDGGEDFGGTAVVSEEFVIRTQRRKELLDITKAPYDAAGDGVTMNTGAIQRAIDDCGAGQTVYLPAGIYLTGALRLHSDMEILLDRGAVLKGTDRVEDYLPKIWSRFEGTELFCYSSLLNMGTLDRDGGYYCSNVVIHGKGTIEGGGRVLAERIISLEREAMKEELEALGEAAGECEKPETLPGRVRPRLINISNSRNVVISGLTLKNGPSWNVHMIYSSRIVTCGCTFYSEDVWNGDGWDPDSSSDCTIFNCEFYTGDDSIAIKSGKNPEGNRIQRPCEHIRIFDCRCAFGHGIAIGSEMSGGISDVAIWDCDMRDSLYGIEIKGTKKRGGYVRNIHVMDSQASRVLLHSVTYNDDGVSAPAPPVFEKCCFESMVITGEAQDHDRVRRSCDAVELIGFEEPGHELSDIVFRDITLGGAAGGEVQRVSMQLCRNITLERIRCL